MSVSAGTATDGLLSSASSSRYLGKYRLFSRLWSVFLIAILTFLILYPVGMLLLGALTSGNPVEVGYSNLELSLDNFVTVLSNQNGALALRNSLITCLGGTFVALVIGLTFSWIVVRTDTPFRDLIGAFSVTPLFMPPLIAAVAWAILGSPKTGLLNTALGWMGFDFRINLYSLGGLIAVFGMYYAPYVYMFTASALRNMDPSLEESAETAGASPFVTMMTVTFPLIAPAIISGMLLSFIIMIGIYGIPAVLGSPANIPLLTTYIFRLVVFTPPLYNTAAAVAVLLMMVTGILVLLQQYALRGRSYTTIGGKGTRPRTLRLGRWRWVMFALAMLYIFVVVVLPLVALSVAAFRKYMFIPNLASLLDAKQYTLGNFAIVLGNAFTMLSVWNTLLVSLITAVFGGLLAFAIGYTVYRSRSVPARGFIDLVTALPIAIPGLVIGVAYLWAWIGLPGGLYGTIWIMALAFIARFLPDTVRALSNSLMQIHRELEEAAWICGRGTVGTVTSIVLPLAWPGLVSAMTLLFVLAVRELGSSLFLYSSDTIVMAVLLLDIYESGNIGRAAAFGLIQIVLIGLVLIVAHLISKLVSRKSNSGSQEVLPRSL
ncbi:iron ABC transporter permease [Bosea sp. (in: a-proteobacteria)]|uniref:ABC transporter permease n=1 Tax=Bosea sp. (in: a-proteobacteria) TaxID=1871050 RepID=UPI0026215A29|nr:iron ABC transporter permease [Bosea sp. (in: a-proteobacteria)]MCO5090217.1 iron ABC transporter permease [Bosea sp. (in: a-proteobacteria)]